MVSEEFLSHVDTVMTDYMIVVIAKNDELIRCYWE